jgi:hypothetical protein
MSEEKDENKGVHAARFDQPNGSEHGRSEGLDSLLLEGLRKRVHDVECERDRIRGVLISERKQSQKAESDRDQANADNARLIQLLHDAEVEREKLQENERLDRIIVRETYEKELAERTERAERAEGGERGMRASLHEAELEREACKRELEECTQRAERSERERGLVRVKLVEAFALAAKRGRERDHAELERDEAVARAGKAEAALEAAREKLDKALVELESTKAKCTVPDTVKAWAKNGPHCMLRLPGDVNDELLAVRDFILSIASAPKRRTRLESAMDIVGKHMRYDEHLDARELAYEVLRNAGINPDEEMPA